MNLDFSKLDGLVTAVIQDHATGRVLMVGFMNEEAFRKTVETGFATFYSRSRNKLWLKGESLRPPAGGEGDLDRLRPGRRAAEGGGDRPGRVPRRLRELLLPPPGRRRVEGVRSQDLRSEGGLRKQA